MDSKSAASSNTIQSSVLDLLNGIEKHAWFFIKFITYTQLTKTLDIYRSLLKFNDSDKIVLDLLIFEDPFHIYLLTTFSYQMNLYVSCKLIFI
jgi:hypothetical protein